MNNWFKRINIFVLFLSNAIFCDWWVTKVNNPVKCKYCSIQLNWLSQPYFIYGAPWIKTYWKGKIDYRHSVCKVHDEGYIMGSITSIGGQNDFHKNCYKKYNKKIKIGIYYEIFSTLSFYGIKAESIYNNWGVAFQCLYSPKGNIQYLSFQPMDRKYYLRDIIIVRSAILHYYENLPFIFYIFISPSFCKATNVADFLNGRKEYYRFPWQFGILISIEMEYDMPGPFNITLNLGLQKMEIREPVYKITLYSLDGIIFGIGVKINLIRKLK